MKSVYLIGDSIRFGSKNSPGYEVFVKEKLKDIVNVYSPNENCRFVQYTLRGLAEWIWEIDTKSIDIVHWNNGLWDVLRLDGDGPLTPLDVYLSMLERTYNKLKIYFPNAKIVFATTTKIIEEDAPKGWERRNQEIELYNKKAKELMLKLGVEINDLFAITNRFDKTQYADWTHPNEKGAEILAQAIIQQII
jgi:hypothetical protein